MRSTPGGEESGEPEIILQGQTFSVDDLINELIAISDEYKKSKSDYDREYRKINKEKLNKQSKEWRENNRGRVKKTKQKYYQNNKSKFRAKDAKRRALELEKTPDYANLKLIELIYDYCPEGYHIDHMKPISRGGLHHESNLCYLPAKVNLSKNNKTIEEFGVDVFNENVIYWQDYLSA